MDVSKDYGFAHRQGPSTSIALYFCDTYLRVHFDGALVTRWLQLP